MRSGPSAWSEHKQDKGLGPKVIAGHPAGGDSGLWMRAYDSLIHIKYSRKEIGEKSSGRRERMNRPDERCELPMEQRLKGLRACLAFIREEALAYGQDDVAGHLAMACLILDSNTRLLPLAPPISSRLS